MDVYTLFATARYLCIKTKLYNISKSCFALSPMWSALIPLLLQFIQHYCVLGDGTYECGDHGRFEYCIDEIPGCVIGCHCHPGYYFDTDTKICEPNSRLIEHHRRNNVIKPAQTQKTDVTPNVIDDTQPASSTNSIDGSVNEIAKDANDLGDWLYNQFFKTIENQVINNTNDKDILTRRSGSQPSIKKPKRSKKWRKDRKSSKQRGKKEMLRRKLLRITENDSLFDISSKSSSDSSDSSSSSSGDLSSMEYEVTENKHYKHDDDDHGHKKIVMINKKPKRPLPSFIFLPNLDTPFYPPIGLPPPPVVPMYPMVPVPPVPLCPITGCIENGVATTAAAPTITTVAAATTTSFTTAPTDKIVSSSVPEITADALITDANPTTDIPKTDTRALRIKNKKKKKAAKLLNNDRTDTEQGINSSKYFEQKMLERLNKKMGNPSSWKKNKKIYTNKFINQNTDAESPFLDNGIVDEFSNNERNQKPMRDDENFPDNVDFKYITQLIHRVDLNNKSNDLPPIEYNPLNNIELYQLPKIHKENFFDYNVPLDTPDGRRTNRPIHHTSDESYYANLGRQIASMIRGADTHEKVVLEETPNKISNDPYLTNNSPTSFWERSVRSPLTYLKTKNKKFEYLKKSNELLFDIENKVEIIASTAPSLTLQELENIVKVMESTKKKIQSKNKPIQSMTKYQSMTNLGTSHRNLNIDLWPQKTRDLRNSFKNSVLSFFNKIRQEKDIDNYHKTKKNNIVKPNENLPGFRMHNSQKLGAWNGQNINRSTKPINQTPSTAKPSFNNSYFKIIPNNYNLENSNKIHQVPAKTNLLAQNKMKPSFLNQNNNINPYFLHHRKYFEDYNNYYMNQNVRLPQFPHVVRIAEVQPSYFPEISHFDYMD